MVRLAFAGDLCLTSLKRAPQEVVTRGFQDIAALFQPYDLSLCNLECSFSARPMAAVGMNVPIGKSPSLQALGVDVFCLANNHVKDSGAEALLEMQAFIQQSHCFFVGAGSNATEAHAMLTLERGGLSIGILNVTDASHYAAGEHEPGVAVLKKKELLRNVRHLSQRVDALVVIIHADLEFTNYPAPWRVQLSRALAPYCKVVVHHHSHTLQGIEVHQGCVIAYSLGNFVFPVHGSQYMRNREGYVDEGMVLAVWLEQHEGGVEARVADVIPTRIGEHGFLRDITPIEQQATLHKLDLYSDALKKSHFLRIHHFRKCREQFKKFVMGIYYTYSKQGLKQALGYIGAHFRTDQHRNWMKSFFTLGFF
ncbi:CapA family protein [Alkalimonas amylolytica]|uniref:Capsule synthesis protein PGA_cap n=1 Tax=Alkalimonas amylolytica TaxID=152573 RepID=A0A1H4CCT7_ALKAM|nr:CapA family protein [Alkalimonas amylolytica]SEA58133.1 capsule synthesis protein PGA_cap [Alkalimonas amylolytica]